MPIKCHLLITFANSLDPDQARHFGSKLDTLLFFLEEFLKKTNLILKKISR